MLSDRISSSGTSLTREANIRRMQGSLARATAEVSSNMKSDVGLELGVGTSLLYQLRADAQQRGAIKTALNTAGLRMTTMQASLTSVGKIIEEMSAETIKVDSLKGVGIDVLAGQAKESLRQMIDMLNVQHDGNAVFAGNDSSRPPLVTSDAAGGPFATIQGLLADAVTANAGPLDGAALDALLTGLDGISSVFDDTNTDPAKTYAGAFYQNTIDGEPTKVRIGLKETLSYDVTADKKVFRDALQGLSLLAMLDAPASQLTAEAKTKIMDRAGALLRGSGDDLVVTAGILGAKQAQVSRSADVQSTALNAALDQIAQLEQPDMFVLSDRIKGMQTQLEATYAITRSLADLSLVNYLR